VDAGLELLKHSPDDPPTFRPTCTRCLRPMTGCYCAHIHPTPSRTRIVFLQHPRERRVAFGTARMAHLALPNSELHVGVEFDDHPRVRALAAAPHGQTVVLYPAPDAVEPEALPRDACRNLLVIDGTWIQARKMLARNALVRSLPRVGFAPYLPSRYRIRREPAPHCRATIEAVVEALERIERDDTKFRPLLRAFDHMVEQQIHYKEHQPNPYTRAHKRRHQGREDPVLRQLRERFSDLVVVYGEANAHPRDSDVPGASELIQLVAIRPASGERFVAVIAPRRPLAPAAPRHLELDAAKVLGGETVGAAMTRWRAFLRRQDVLCTWGSYTLDLLRAEGDPPRPALDLRSATARWLGRRIGGAEAVAQMLGAENPSTPWTAGRAGQRIVALTEIVERAATQHASALTGS